MEVLLLHLLTQIYLYPHFIICANWSTSIWKSCGLNILAHSRSRQWFKFGLSWSANSNPCPHWMWYNQQSWYKKQSCQGRSWLLPLTVHIWQGCIEWWNDCWCWEVSHKCMAKHDVDAFDELHFIVYHENYLEFDIERFPPTSDNIRQQYCAHICSVIYGYTLLSRKTLTWIHLNMVIV